MIRTALACFVILSLSACANDPKSNPKVVAGTPGAEGEAQVNCVAKGGLLVSKKGGGWWCKMNGQLLPLSNF